MRLLLHNFATFTFSNNKRPLLISPKFKSSPEPRWPDGSLVCLPEEEGEPPEEDDVESDEPEDEEPPRARGRTPKTKGTGRGAATAKAKSKGRDKAKDGKVSDNGRAVNTLYYHHASYSLMPDPNLIIRSTD